MSGIDEHTLVATLDDDTVLDVMSAEVTLDDSWSPYAQASLAIVTPADTSVIDPREVVRVHLVTQRRTGDLVFVSDLTAIYSGQAVSSLTTAYGAQLVSDVSDLPARRWGSEFIPSSIRRFNLGLRARSIGLDGTTVIELASDEALLQDIRVTALVDFVYTDAPTLRDLIDFDSGDARLSDLAFALQAGDADVNIPPGLDPLLPNNPYVAYTPGQSYWDRYQAFVALGDLRLWCDEARQFWMETNDTTTPGTVTLAYAGNITDATDQISREQDTWGDELLVEFLPNPADVSMYYRATARVPLPAIPNKTVYIKINAITPFTGVIDPTLAESMLDRIIRRGRVLPVTAISDYSATPRMAATIDIPTGPPLTGVVQAVTWRFPDAEMSVTTRNLEEV